MAIVGSADQANEQAIKRMKRLEGELERLLAAVDARLSEPSGPRRPIVTTRAETSWLETVSAWDMHHLAAVGGLAMLLFTTGWGGSSLFYSSRLTAQVERELRPYAEELAETVATIQTDLAPRLAVADELKAEIDQARLDLLARDEELDATITEAQSQLLAIRDSAIDDIERRLSDQTDDLNVMLEASRQQAVELDQGLKDVALGLAAFDRQLPVLTEGFGELATGLMQNRERLDRTEEEMAGLDSDAPALLESLDRHRTALDGGAKSLAILQAQLEALKTQTTRSSQQLDQVLSEGRSRVADWEGADRDIANRKEEIMRSLDHYADNLNARVREFIEAINIEPTFTGG
jgi:chromosome segregation ATPase